MIVNSPLSRLLIKCAPRPGTPVRGVDLSILILNQQLNASLIRLHTVKEESVKEETVKDPTLRELTNVIITG